MFNISLNQKQVLWITNNSLTVIRVVIFILTIVSAALYHGVVLADPVMGGSVG
ncbi:MAG TPA: hypothetical protein VJZ78_02750 [Anaerolineales bacterium]|nr:hypothetical protein [Anaerolineales bacterium]